MNRICANCIYFHPEEHEEDFGGCGVTIDHQRKAFSDSCIDFERFEIIPLPKEIITGTRLFHKMKKFFSGKN